MYVHMCACVHARWRHACACNVHACAYAPSVAFTPALCAEDVQLRGPLVEVKDARRDEAVVLELLRVDLCEAASRRAHNLRPEHVHVLVVLAHEEVFVGGETSL